MQHHLNCSVNNNPNAACHCGLIQAHETMHAVISEQPVKSVKYIGRTRITVLTWPCGCTESFFKGQYDAVFTTCQTCKDNA